MMKKSSWACTIIIQFSLCFAVYVALNLGHPQKLLYRRAAAIADDRPLDLFFISVAGGLRPLHRQTHLLKLMRNVAKAYNAEFVVNISELGEEDPLLQNATQLFYSLKIPWYSTGTSRGKRFGYFLKSIKLSQGESLDIVFINTGSQQGKVLTGSSTSIEISYLNWLAWALKATNGDWRIVVGSHTLIACEQRKEQKEAKQVTMFHQILTKYGVNVYVSKQGCTNSASQDGVAWISIPDPKEKEHYVTPRNEASNTKIEMEDGFLLHRVRSLELVTYFINSSGQVIDRSIVNQKGKEVM